MTSRVVDLGREDELVTWHEWMHRCEKVMTDALTEEQRSGMLFRVTLVDGRSFRVAHALTHMARGKCELGPDRWVDAKPKNGKASQEKASGAVGGAICDVITGYMFIGVGADGLPTTLSVPPTEIVSVECVYAKPEAETEPFGFARAIKAGDPRPTQEEVEEEAIGD